MKLRILIFILILFAFGKEKIIKTKAALITPVNILQVYTAADDTSANLFDKNIWTTTNFPTYEFIVLKFSDFVNIKKIKFLFQDTKPKQINIFSYNGKNIVTADKDSLFLNFKTKILIILFAKTDFDLTYIIDDSLTAYYLSFDDFSNPLKIKKIIITDANGKQLKFILVKNKKNNIKLKFLPHYNFACKTQTQVKSASFNPNGYFTLYFSNYDTDKFYFGTWQKINENKLFLKGKIYSFSDKKLKIQSLETKAEIFSNYIKIKNFVKITFKPKDKDFFVLVDSYYKGFEYDIRYATENNFANTKMYPCAKCMLKYNVAKDLAFANEEFLKYGYRIKLFDCYRPFSVQKFMWNLVKNKNYVAPPSIGSSHNRGTAVDLTLIDTLGNELDFGTGYDSFSKKAWTINYDLPEKILKNREFLQNILKKHNFRPIKTEWWHFYHISTALNRIYDYPLPCKK